MQAQIPHFVRMVSLVMADQLRTVVLNSITAFSRLWDPFDLVADPHAASAGWPLEKEDGSVEVSCTQLVHLGSGAWCRCYPAQSSDPGLHCSAFSWQRMQLYMADPLAVSASCPLDKEDT